MKRILIDHAFYDVIDADFEMIDWYEKNCMDSTDDYILERYNTEKERLKTKYKKVMAEDKGLRLNAGKTRHDLINPIALEGLAKVLTVGAEKYTVKYINKWERIFVASNATKLSLTIANQCVVTVMKNSSGSIILSIMKGNERTARDGECCIKTEKESWIELDGRIQFLEKETQDQNGYGTYENSISQNQNTANCVSKDVKYVEQKNICTLTMIIPMGNLEESFVVNAITASDSWEIMWKDLKERSIISRDKENFKNIGERNWENGMKWSNVYASVKRHLEKIIMGEDYDTETGLLHADHLQANAHFLSAYYKIYPQGDDRPHKYLKMPKIGLDVDDVICDFIPAFMERFGLSEPDNWCWSYGNSARFKELAEDPNAITDFYMKLKPKIDPRSIPFEPHCYITSRSIPSEETTKQWIEANGFACKPVYTVPFGASKVEVARASGIDIFVDDKYENFVELNNAGICCYLFDAAHNRRYNVGHKRLYNLADLVK